MDQYSTVTFKAGSEETAMISALLMAEGFEGVEEKEDSTIASVPRDAFDEAAISRIFKKFGVEYSVEIVEQQNWNASWEKSFEPVLVDDFAVVRADFHPPVTGIKYDIIVTPKMSFGTGHHATTFMMMQAMRDMDFAGHSVIDFGTGTGVLAILAEKMGAIDILAIDYDQWSINNAKENLEANNCEKTRLLLADEIAGDKKVDFILANINLNVIKENISRIKDACHGNSQILISGFLSDDEQQMKDILSAGGFYMVKNIYKNNWMAMLIKTR